MKTQIDYIKYGLLLGLLLVIVLILGFYTPKYLRPSESFACGCPAPPHPAPPICQPNEYVCGLDNKCHPLCGNLVDIKGNYFPCDERSGMPFNPNMTFQLTNAYTGEITYQPELITPDPSQINFDFEYMGPGAIPLTDTDRARMRLFRQPSCHLVASPDISATYIPNTQKYVVCTLLSAVTPGPVNGTQPIHVTTTVGFQNTDNIKVGSEITQIVSIKNEDVFWIKSLQSSHNVGETITLLN